MAHTNAWDESTPLGSENASTADNYLRRHRLDLGERLEDMFYGFNAASNAAPENDYGVKSLKFYKQTSDPTAATDYSHFYVKLVDGVPELFYQDDTNTTLQLTSGGSLKSTANLVIDGTSTLTGNVTMAGTLGVTGTTEVTGVATLGDGSLLKTSAAPTTDAMIANKKYADDAPKAQAKIDNVSNAAPGASTESITFPNGLIMKFGEESVAADTTDEVTYGNAFPTGCLWTNAAFKSKLTTLHEAAHAQPKSGSETTILEVTNSSNGTLTVSWVAIGY